eukprot:SAG11_NODE_7374_length_1154_cov_2.181991_1_plen_211_part_00
MTQTLPDFLTDLGFKPADRERPLEMLFASSATDMQKLLKLSLVELQGIFAGANEGERFAYRKLPAIIFERLHRRDFCGGCAVCQHEFCEVEEVQSRAQEQKQCQSCTVLTANSDANTALDSTQTLHLHGAERRQYAYPNEYATGVQKSALMPTFSKVGGKYLDVRKGDFKYMKADDGTVTVELMNMQHSTKEAQAILEGQYPIDESRIDT